MMIRSVRHPTRRRRTCERGTALLLALLVGALLAVFGTWVLTSASRAREMAKIAHYDIQARLMAESAIEKAIGELAAGRLEYEGESEIAFGHGELSVVVSPVAGRGDERRIEASGTFPRVSAKRRTCRIVAYARQSGSAWSIVRWVDEKP